METSPPAAASADAARAAAPSRTGDDAMAAMVEAAAWHDAAMDVDTGPPSASAGSDDLTE